MARAKGDVEQKVYAGILSASDCCLCKGFRNLEHAGSVLGCSQGLSGHVQDRFASRNGPYCSGATKLAKPSGFLV